MTKITIVVGDQLNDIPFILQDNAGNAINLTGTTCKFKAQHVENPTIAFNGSMTITDAVNGKVKYTTAASDFATVGDYVAEIEVTFGSTQIQTFNDIFVTARPQIPV